MVVGYYDRRVRRVLRVLRCLVTRVSLLSPSLEDDLASGALGVIFFSAIRFTSPRISIRWNDLVG